MVRRKSKIFLGLYAAALAVVVWRAWITYGGDVAGEMFVVGVILLGLIEIAWMRLRAILFGVADVSQAKSFTVVRGRPSSTPPPPRP
jgi:hypothetical protein